MDSQSRSAWHDVVQAKRQEQEALLKPYTNAALSSQEEDIIRSANARFITDGILQGKFTASEVTLAHIKQAVKAHEQTNCLTEICFEHALARAKELDDYFRQHNKLVGPLHGVPMTLKDQFDIKGLDTTLGYVGKAFQTVQEDAVFVTMLKEMGAVVIAKTNLPQSIMWCETDNPLFGCTTHPLEKHLTPGGSSGGEGAVINLGGSVIGLGTDIGGSVRIPSHMCGLYGLKPSSGRLPYFGLGVSTDGQEHVPSVVGPLARDLDSVLLFTKEAINLRPWLYDAKVHPIPWREDVYEEVQSRPLVIGFFVDDGMVKVHPPIERAIREACQKLEEAGHEVVEWDVSGHAECIQIMDQFYLADGAEDIRREVEKGGEPFIPHVEALVKRAISAELSVYEYWQLNRKKIAAQQRQLKKWTEFRSPLGRKVDIVISPTMPHGLVPHKSCRWVGYTKVWNLLDYTALTMPVKSSGREPNDITPSYEPRNDIDRWNWELYDKGTTDPGYVSIQLIGRRLEEEKVLGAAKVFDRVFGEWRYRA